MQARPAHALRLYFAHQDGRSVQPHAERHPAELLGSAHTFVCVLLTKAQDHGQSPGPAARAGLEAKVLSVVLGTGSRCRRPSNGSCKRNAECCHLSPSLVNTKTLSGFSGSVGQVPASRSLVKAERQDRAFREAGDPLTFQRTEEVEKGIIGDLLGDGSDGASTLVFLLFLDRFDGDVFSFLPVNSAPAGARQPSTHTS